MRIIWKFQIATARLSVLEIPEGAQLLHVATQRETITLWYMVDPQALKEKKSIVVIGTGEGIHSRSDSLTHLGTVLTADENFVWHVFELKQ
jgi:hypothetical protein